MTGTELLGAGAATTPPSSAARYLRPLGYLLIGLVWAAIALVILALGPGILVFVAVDGTMELGQQWQSLVSQPFELVVFAIAVPLLVLIWGPGLLWYLPNASWPLAALSFVYAGRALRPSYRDERISRTVKAERGEAIGLPTFSNVALSLVPVRRSRTTDALMRFYASGWIPDGAMFRAMLPAGLAWLLAFVGLARDVPAGLRVAFLALAVVLVASSVVLGHRAWHRRFYAPAVDRGRMPSETAVSELSPEERRARLQRLRAARDERLGG